ncbi:TIGR03086 family protein [Egibacter rhizosphaerae]|uniref:TIGR03086 family protein n=1 Tax=Egibacter rhizosphaerae TaxID=1670831 RepID=A0A411YBM9_9ACTN|nr:TIGR03086 family metal-binding protein [Egibacter rhizosphaerae]QBI18596.1 TIGR03086 family protein [Egibacter rhizosphaerae]
MALSDLTAAERHRRIAGEFTERVQRVADWDAPAPVAGWTARDVVDHLVTWLPGFLSAGDHELPTGPTVAESPVAAWTFHAAAVQALLDDPERAATLYSHERMGSMPVGEAIDRFYTTDVFMHTWDLARAGGQDAALEPEFCATLLAGMEPMEEAMRSSGQYGPKVDVPADADPQTQMIAFIGRNPSWQPDLRPRP